MEDLNHIKEAVNLLSEDLDEIENINVVEHEVFMKK